jgi:uncharacterized protein YecE (DUF72 family)
MRFYTTHLEVDTSSVRVGCSGWQYRHWRGNFYPVDVPQSRWLEYYATHFDTVEINNTFYRLPEAPTFAAWKCRVPRGFLYAVKASRFLTHMKKLKDPGRSYSDRALDNWAEWLAGRSRAGLPVYAYFNNDTGGHAPRDAVRLRDRIRMNVSS